MNPSKSEERPPDPDDIWQNLFARVELGDQLEIIRDRLKQLSEQFAKADPGPKDGSVNVEDTHVKQAASILLALARTPEIYAETGAAEVFISYASQQKADAEALCGHLQRAAFRCFLAPESIHYADWRLPKTGCRTRCRIERSARRSAGEMARSSGQAPGILQQKSRRPSVMNSRN